MNKSGFKQNMEDLSELEIINLLLNKDKITIEESIFLESKGLLEPKVNGLELSDNAKLVLESLKNTLNSIIEKGEVSSEKSLDTLIDRITFHSDKGINISIILGLKQDANVFTLGDLLKKDLRYFYILNSDEAIQAIEKKLIELGNL